MADDEVARLLATLPERVRRDSETLIALMERATGQPPEVHDGRSVGFGSYHYEYPTGRQGDAAAAGFWPRARETSIYFGEGLGFHEEALAKLGPHRAAVVCVYVRSLDGIDLAVLEQMVRESYARLTAGVYSSRARHPT